MKRSQLHPACLLTVLTLATLSTPVWTVEPDRADTKGPTPMLAAEFGKVVEIEGRVVELNSKALLGKVMLEVHWAGDRPLNKKPVLELLKHEFFSLILPQKGEWARLRGIESGSFTGIPKEVLKEMKIIPATTDFHFSPEFKAIQRLQPRQRPLQN